MLYPNRYYNEVCYARTILYVILYDKEIHLVKQILKKACKVTHNYDTNSIC